MILQRIASAIRHQNWSQIVTEILIVVIGIFLGLQVQSWYDGKRAEETEQRFVGYLITDVENNLAYLERMDDFYNIRIIRARDALKMLDQDTLHPEQREAFEQAIREINQFNGLDNYLGSFLNGNLDQVLGASLRRTIENFLAVLNSSKSVRQHNEDGVRASKDYMKLRMSVGRINDNDGLIHYDFEKLKTDEFFRAAVANGIRALLGYRNRNDRVIEHNSRLLPILKDYQAGKEIEEVSFE